MTTAKSSLSIAIDVMGSDLGPGEVISGVQIAFDNGWIQEEVILVGDEATIQAELKA